MRKSRSIPFAVGAAVGLSLLTGCAGQSPARPGTWAATGPSAHAPAQPTAGHASSGLPSVAVYAPQQPLTQAQLQAAAQVLRERAAGMGLRSAQVTLVPQGIQVSAPGATRDELVALGQTGSLAFRPVLAEAQMATSVTGASPSPSGTGQALAQTATGPTTSGRTVTGQTGGMVPADLQTAFDALDCVHPSSSDVAAVEVASPAAQIVACDTAAVNGIHTKYALGPVAVPGADVASAKASYSTQIGEWQVDLSFNSAGTSAFANVTAQLAANQSPTNEFAIVLSGTVQSSPYVSTAIPGGQAQITGSFDQAGATALAAELTHGSIPPLTLEQTMIPG
ncbi:SecDF P1 head subdomain-containing protein [Streptacidiphilus jiangxiensis]|uniref:Preprotein translocase subunit SecD n=1 Tax=Streptacidiphilus jiangxiensis TaxID=235985 RepID=A0A1H7Y9V1_STRJI|nr:hypothetical protein [Streptacidiphilus jiangxiensis]SEM42763.1 preprotein translocase subunit SecD [Streptacidiphilus jiangxiensis]